MGLRESERKRLALALAMSLGLHLGLVLPWASFPPPAKQLSALTVRLPDEAKQQARAAPVSSLTTSASEVATSKAAPRREGRPAPRELTGRLREKALAVLAQEAFYPREAIERGLEGRVVLLISVAGDGTVRTVELARSSGHALLDEAALRAASRIGSLPFGARQFLLPVEFRLE
ncbi:MAG: TonB family protein [Rhodocyclaceae bacterium]|nr:TonB family protein [Rhodocyclaceae bacterium]